MAEAPATPWHKRISRFELGCLAVVALAFLVRVSFVVQPTIIWDTAWLLMLSRSFAERGDFWIRWSDPAAPEFSGYWPPLFPIFVSPLVKLFGPSFSTLALGSVLASALLTIAVFFTTRDLYGRTPAFAAMALVAANPAFYVSDSKGMTESLLAFTMTLTVWAFLKSLDKPKWLPVAGVFAFLTYLGKASLGLPFVGAAVLALGAWRVYTRGWREVVRSKWDMGVAIAGLLGLVLLALTRTERVGGIGVGMIEPIGRAFSGASCNAVHHQFSLFPDLGVGWHCWAMLYPIKVVFVAAFLLAVTLPFSTKLLDVIRAGRSERTDALWLASILPLVAGAIFTTSFFYTEGRALVDFDNIRYLTPSMVPFLWLTIPHWKFESTPRGIKGEHVARRHHMWFGLAIGSFFVLELLHPAAGSANLERVVMFVVLASVPLLFGFFAYRTQYSISERRLADGTTQQRFVEDRRTRPDGKILLGGAIVLMAPAVLAFMLPDLYVFTTILAVAVGIALAMSVDNPRERVMGAVIMVVGGAAWFFSAWYLTLGVGVVVALLSGSPKARALGCALVLLGSAAPGVQAALPVEDAAVALERLPEGTIVGMNQQIVFPAAVTPSHIRLRLIEPSEPIPDDIQVLLLQHTAGDPAIVYANFTRVTDWNYRHEISPTLKARIWIEENVLGQQIRFQQVRGEALYVRDGTGLIDLYS